MTEFAGWFRQRMRNPSILFAMLMFLLVLNVPADILAPDIIRTGIDGYREAKRLQQREFAEAPGTWGRPWLIEGARIMIYASQPHEWKTADFRLGPCAAENTRQLPVSEFREAIEQPCERLSNVRISYAINCAETNHCSVPEEARRELEAVIAMLDGAYADAGLVDQYSLEEANP